MPTGPTVEATPKQQTLDPNWPQPGYTGVQPWQVAEPPAISHDRGFIVDGAAGEPVVELAAALRHLGYETAISRGEDHKAVFGETVKAAVRQFRISYGIQEDPAVLAVTTPDTVGPWTWEALFRLLRRAQDAQAQQAATPAPESP